MSGIGYLERGQFVEVGLHGCRECAQAGRPLRRCQPCPAPLRCSRALHGVVHRVGVGVVN
ncbi:Uncharacterised protein [Mycobacterium tuberculosis]|nr:Uncharacterised protein [Mycobacterium tuberculosis]CKR36867.1 Uncharacterised protein [Mycobacterium tuberculosis]CKV03115.1 Uncharacterised protein [Mycobacterium tuberculosis]CNL86591.1 Uncharacterised protein [Mycobacterium tuberculosis]